MYLRKFNPGVFQGNLRKRNYFEGWYFKHVAREPDHTFSLIPGVSLAENDSHAFIQIMDGYTGNTDYIRYPLSDFIWDKRKLWLKIGSSVFTDHGIILDIESDNIKMSGQINYTDMIKYPGSFFSPGIMGWYTFVPFMECYHGIVSVNHDLNGKIAIDGVRILRAPVSGEMSRRIKESVDSEIHLELSDNNHNRIYEGTGNNVGLEVTDPGVLKV